LDPQALASRTALYVFCASSQGYARPVSRAQQRRVDAAELPAAPTVGDVAAPPSGRVVSPGAVGAASVDRGAFTTSVPIAVPALTGWNRRFGWSTTRTVATAAEVCH